MHLVLVKCMHPLHLPMIDDSVKVVLDNEPAVIDTNATFSCFPGQTFSGPQIYMHGEWRMGTSPQGGEMHR